MGELRIIAGTHGSRRIATPRRGGTRPTAERVREALFSMLGDVSGARVLDLFAGSGAIGIEALSRGAESAVFVDSSRSAAACVRENLQLLGMEAEVIERDWRRAVDDLARREQRFDLVFVDPPYASVARIAEELGERVGVLLSREAVLVSESSARAPMDIAMPVERERRHGDTLLRLHVSQ